MSYFKPFILFAKPAATGGGVDLTNGLVGWWKFDNNANDSSPTGSNGTTVGSPVYVTGQVNQAISFNGSTQYVDANASYDFGLTDFSYSFWINTGTTDKNILGNFKTSGGAKGYAMYIWPSGGMAAINVVAYGSSGNIDNYLQANPAKFTLNIWQHIIVTNTRSGNDLTVNVYVNGVLGYTNTATVGDMTSGHNLFIGSYLSGSGSMNGSLDDVRIYNKALSSAEITALYNYAG